MELVVSIDRLSPYKSSCQPKPQDLVEEDLLIQDEFLEDIGQVEASSSDQFRPPVYVSYPQPENVISDAPVVTDLAEQGKPRTTSPASSQKPVLDPQESIWEVELPEAEPMFEPEAEPMFEESQKENDSIEIDQPIAHRTRRRQRSESSNEETPPRKATLPC